MSYYIVYGRLWKIKMYLINAIFIVFCLIKHSLSNLNVSLNQEIRENLNHCVNNISENYFLNEDFIIILDFQENSFRINKPTVLYNDLKYFPLFLLDKIDAYIILLKNETNLKSVLQFLSNTQSWNPRGKFIINLEGKNITETFGIFYYYFIFNIVVLKENFGKEIEIFTYFPYNYSNSNDITKPLLIGSCTLYKINASTYLFSNKFTKTWNSTVIKIATIQYAPYVQKRRTNAGNGLEITILDIAQSILKFKTEYLNKTYKSWGRLQSNGSYSYAYGDLQNKEADLGTGKSFI